MSTQNQNVIKLYQILQQLNDLEMTALRQGGDYDGLIILNRHVLANLIDDFQTVLDELFNASESQTDALPVKDSSREEYTAPLAELDAKPADATEDVQPQIVAGGLGAAPASPASLNLDEDSEENTTSDFDSQNTVDQAQTVLDQVASDSQADSASQGSMALADSVDSSANEDAASNNDENEDVTDDDSSESIVDSSSATERDHAASDKIIDGSIASPQPDDQNAGSNSAANLNLDDDEGEDGSADTETDSEVDTADENNAGDIDDSEPDLNLTADSSDDDASDDSGVANFDNLLADNGYNG